MKTKVLREFQAAKANKQSNESYVNEAHGFNVSGTGGYQNNDNAVISLAENFNNSTHYNHPPRLQSLPNNNNDNNDNYSVSYGENGQCVLRDLTIHSNLTDKHQFVVLSPTSLSSAFEIPNGNANQTLPMTDNTKLIALYLILCKL
ncbi:unnamed protein product [Schistosoma haematobium]|nr:unnamed protein product [Schistosoma haematobium]